MTTKKKTTEVKAEPVPAKTKVQEFIAQYEDDEDEVETIPSPPPTGRASHPPHRRRKTS